MGRRHRPSNEGSKSGDKNNVPTDSQVQSTDNGEQDVTYQDQLKEINKKLEMLPEIHKNVIETKTDITNIQSEMKNIQESITSARSVADEALQKAESAGSDLSHLSLELQCNQNEIIKLRNENQQLRDHMNRLEAHSRRDNLILGGITERPNEDCLQLVCNVLRNMGLCEQDESITDKIKITRCHRLGAKLDGKSRPIIFKCHYFPDRETIWEARKKLAETGMWLSEDFPQDIVNTRRFLDPIRKKAIKEGKFSILSVDRLVVDGRTYTVNNINSLPPSLRPEEVYTRRMDTHTGFFSRYSPLSNFYKKRFKIDGMMFTSVEQYFQYCKALHCDDLDQARSIMETDDPALCKKLGGSLSIPDLKIWEEKSLELMQVGCEAKFKQNTNLRDFLVSTKNTILVEANPRDTFWGVGKKLSDDDFCRPEKWEGAKNHLGRILRRVRDQFNGITSGSTDL